MARRFRERLRGLAGAFLPASALASVACARLMTHAMRHASGRTFEGCGPCVALVKPSIAQLVERWTVVGTTGAVIHRSLVRIRLEGMFFVVRGIGVRILIS